MISGTNTLLIGGTGSGKTYCLRTFLDAGITPFIISTEPGLESTLGDVLDKIHYKYIAPASASWDDLIDSGRKINTLNFESLAKLPNINKAKYSQFIDVLTTCNNFVCDRTGEAFGDVANWGPDRVLVLDSLSGLNIMAMNLVVGSKPTKSMSDWGVAMDNLERFLQKLCTDTKCFFVLISHSERETDEVSGAVQVMASTLGRKLAPRLPRFFDDVILVKRDGTSFNWSTAAINTDLKARNLPIADTIQPSFVQIVEAWKRKGGVIPQKNSTATEAAPPTPAAV